RVLLGPHGLALDGLRVRVLLALVVRFPAIRPRDHRVSPPSVARQVPIPAASLRRLHAGHAAVLRAVAEREAHVVAAPSCSSPTWLSGLTAAGKPGCSRRTAMSALLPSCSTGTVSPSAILKSLGPPPAGRPASPIGSSTTCAALRPGTLCGLACPSVSRWR